MKEQNSSLVYRQATGPAPPLPQPTTFRIRWTFVAYVLAPLLLAFANLGEAYFEKLRGFLVGANKLQEFRGRGEAVHAAALRAATDQGNAHYAALIAEARYEANSEVEIGRKERETSISQGNDKGAIQNALSKGLILALYGKTDEIVRLVLERSEMEMGAKYGRYLKVDYKTGQYEVRELPSNETDRSTLQNKLALYAWSTGYELQQLKEQVISNGGREMVSFTGAYCPSDGGSHD